VDQAEEKCRGGQREYWCFISYRHADNQEPGRQWATWLHQQIETYEVPADLVGTVNERGDTIPERIFPVFRDEDELPADADLASPIYAALDRSKFLVVLCSPRAAQSPYVSSEIAYFKKIGRGDRILAAIIDGEPNATDHPGKAGLAPECFPQALRYEVDAEGNLTANRTEPIAPDFRLPDGSQGWTTPAAYRQFLESRGDVPRREINGLVEACKQRQHLMLLKILAGIMGVAVGTLTKRDQAYQLTLAKKRQRTLRRWLTAVGLLALISLFAFGVAGWQWDKTAKANSRNVQMLHQASVSDYAAALQRMDRDGKWNEGVAYLVRSLNFWPENSLAAQRLFDTLLLHAPSHWPDLTLVHEQEVQKAVFSLDGSKVATASDNVVRLWDSATGKALGRPLVLGSLVYGLAFSPDGSKIATASGKNVRIWDVATGAEVGVALSHKDRVYAVAFSPDGSRIVTACKDKTARLWDVASRKQIGEPFSHGGAVSSASFSPDGLEIVTASSDAARIWDISTGKQLGGAFVHEGINSAVFSPDGSMIVTAGDDKNAVVWDVATGQMASVEILAQDGIVYDAEFSPDGSRIVTASEDNTARVWNTFTGEQLGDPLQHDDSVRSAVFSPDGSRVLTASLDDAARIWGTGAQMQTSEPFFHDQTVTSAVFSPDSSKIVTTSKDKTARIWNATTGTQIGGAFLHTEPVWSAAFSPDGASIATVTRKEIRIWNTDTGTLLHPPISPGVEFNSVAFAPDGSRVITTNGDHTARIWSVNTGQQVGVTLSHSKFINCAVFSPDGSKIATASADWTARIWDATTGKQIGNPLSHDLDVRSVAFSPDGSKIATASADRTARIWDVGTGRQIGKAITQFTQVNSAAFSPDGSEIVTGTGDVADEDGSADKMVARVWDIATGRQVGEPLVHAFPVVGAAFSPDGSKMLTVSGNSARLWDGRQIEAAPAEMSEVPVAIAGVQLNSEGAVEKIPLSKRVKIVSSHPTGGDDWGKLFRWLTMPSSNRPISPFSDISSREMAEHLRDGGSMTGLQEVLKWDFTIPLSRLLLARKVDPGGAASLRQYDLQHLPPNAVLWERASAILLDQGQSRLALDAAQKAVALDGRSEAARKALDAASKVRSAP